MEKEIFPGFTGYILLGGLIIGIVLAAIFGVLSFVKKLLSRATKPTLLNHEGHTGSFCRLDFLLNNCGGLMEISSQTRKRIFDLIASNNPRDWHIEIAIKDKRIDTLAKNASAPHTIKRYNELNQIKSDAVKFFLVDEWIHRFIRIENNLDDLLSIIRKLLEYEPEGFDPNYHEKKHFDFYIRKGKRKYVTKGYSFVVAMPNSFRDGQWEYDLDVIDFGAENVCSFVIIPYFIYLAEIKSSVSSPQEFEYISCLINYSAGLH